jgi:hypothetical protein
MFGHGAVTARCVQMILDRAVADALGSEATHVDVDALDWLRHLLAAS